MRSSTFIAFLGTSSALLQTASVARPAVAAARVSPLVSVAAVPLATPRSEEVFSDPTIPLLSGLKGKAMLVDKEDIPSKAQVRAILPPHVLTRDTKKSLMYAAMQGQGVIAASVRLSFNATRTLTLARGGANINITASMAGSRVTSATIL